MAKQNLWSNSTEIEFFNEALAHFSSPEQLFYNLEGGYFAYVPKGQDAEGQTLQSRNSLIGQFTEKWCKSLFSPIAKTFGLFAINGMICEELGLTGKSSADLAFCTKDALEQRVKDVKLVFEIKMSVVSNYKYDKRSKTTSLIGDYTEHKGNPSLLRSDSMLKAIGKSINIRVSGPASTKIPIVILGNSPITKSYVDKVDFLKTSGVVQGFLSLNPKPSDSAYIKDTPKLGFQTITSIQQIQDFLSGLLNGDMNFFSSMISKVQLGKIIAIASQEKTEIQKAEKFLSLINN